VDSDRLAFKKLVLPKERGASFVSTFFSSDRSSRFVLVFLLINGGIMPETLIKINAPNVVSEVIEREIVCVNLETGCYFSLQGCAVDIWRDLQCGAMGRQWLVAKYATNNSGSITASDVDNFLSSALEHQLVVIVEQGNSSSAEWQNRALVAEQAMFNEKPRLEVFSDLQDILLLDPIHDVDDNGWPTASLPANQV